MSYNITRCLIYVLVFTCYFFCISIHNNNKGNSEFDCHWPCREVFTAGKGCNGRNSNPDWLNANNKLTAANKKVCIKEQFSIMNFTIMIICFIKNNNEKPSNPALGWTLWAPTNKNSFLNTRTLYRVGVRFVLSPIPIPKNPHSPKW